jgi:protein O-mannosyl-transferase
MSRARARTPARPVRTARPAPRPRAPVTALPPSDWLTHALPLATLAVLAVALYLPCVDGPFVYDDPNAVSQSQLIRSLTAVTLFLELSTRPLSDYSYAVNYAISGLDTWSYHLTSILLHAANVLLLYGIAWATFGTTPLVRRYGAVRRALAWAAAALFAAHPLASETVAYVSSRSEVLAAFWMLLALGSFLVGVLTTRRRLRRAAIVVLPMATAAGVGSKEIAAVLPFALVLYDWLFLSANRRLASLRHRLIALSVLPLAVGGAFLLARAYLSPSPMGDYAATAGLGFDRFTRWEYLMTQFGVIVYYLQLVVLPVRQTFDYDWPLARTPFAAGVLIPLALLIALVVVALRNARTQPLLTFAIGWTLLILAPTSSVLPIADLAVERRMYLPLAGLMLLAAAWLWDLVQRLPEPLRHRPPWTYAGVVLVPLAVFGVLTYRRAVLWGDAIALHEDGVAKATENPRVRLNLGVTYLNSGQRDRAYHTLLVAKTLFDRGESVNAFTRIGAFIEYNLGAVLFARKEFDRAETELKRSLELGGQYLALRPMAFMLLSRIAAQRSDWVEAAADMTEALKYQDDPDWRVDLAQMQLRAGDPAGARKSLQQVLYLHPNHQRARRMLAEMNKKK